MYLRDIAFSLNLLEFWVTKSHEKSSVYASQVLGRIFFQIFQEAGRGGGVDF